MFCPTAVDQFFVTQLSKLDKNQNHKNNNTYKQGVSLEQRKVEAKDSRIRYGLSERFSLSDNPDVP